MRQAEISAHGFVHRGEIAGDKNVGPAVVIVVEEKRGEPAAVAEDACVVRDFGESVVVIVVVEKIFALKIGDVEIGPAIVVVIAGDHGLGVRDLIDARAVRDVLECAIAVVQEKLSGTVFAADEKIEQAVVVDVGPNRGLGAGGRLGEAGGFGDVGECAVAIIFQERLALRNFPAAAENEDVRAAVVVVVGLNDVEAAHLIGKVGLPGAIGEGAVAVVVEKVQRLAHIHAGGHDVE